MKTEEVFNKYVSGKYPGWESLPDKNGFKDAVSEAFYAGCDLILKQWENNKSCPLYTDYKKSCMALKKHREQISK